MKRKAITKTMTILLAFALTLALVPAGTVQAKITEIPSQPILGPSPAVITEIEHYEVYQTFPNAPAPAPAPARVRARAASAKVAGPSPALITEMEHYEVYGYFPS